MKNLDKEQLKQYYLAEEKTPYEIAEILKCDHKTVRKYLRLYEVPLRSASEYNFLARKSHISPTEEQLISPLSIKAHIAYLCEGWHTEKTSMLHFCNTDPLLINVFVKCLKDIYKAETISFSIISKTKEEAAILLLQYPSAKVYLDPDRKTPIVRIKSGGKKLASEFISNAYKILSSKD